MGLYDAAETESREDSMLPPVLPFAVLEHHIKPAQNQRKAQQGAIFPHCGPGIQVHEAVGGQRI